MENIEEFVDSVNSEREDIIKKDFPRKINELNQLLKSSDFNFDHQRTSLFPEAGLSVPDLLAMHRALKCTCFGGHDAEKHKTECCKSLAVPSTPIPFNTTMQKLLEVVKPQFLDLVNYADLLKLLLIIRIPKVEDGNNVGVEIQHQALREIAAAHSEALSCYNDVMKYFEMRGDLLYHLVNNPYIEDWRRTVAEYDEREFRRLTINLKLVRFHYISLYDLINKNWDKIIKPRTSNHDNMY